MEVTVKRENQPEDIYTEGNIIESENGDLVVIVIHENIVELPNYFRCLTLKNNRIGARLLKVLALEKSGFKQFIGEINIKV